MCVKNNDNISKGSSLYGVGGDIIIHLALLRYIKEVQIKENILWTTHIVWSKILYQKMHIFFVKNLRGIGLFVWYLLSLVLNKFIDIVLYGIL